jgi:hypothetical protein
MVESMGGEWSGASAKFFEREKVGNSMRASGVSNIYVEVYHHYYLFICVFYIMLSSQRRHESYGCLQSMHTDNLAGGRSR